MNVIPRYKEQKILELEEKIDELSADIEEVNEDNIQYIDVRYPDKYYYLLTEVLDDEGKEISELAENILKKYGVVIPDALRYVGISEETINLFTARTVDEFIKSLEKYVDWLEEWRDAEVEAEEETQAMFESYEEKAVRVIDRSYLEWLLSKLRALDPVEELKRLEEEERELHRTYGNEIPPFGVLDGLMRAEDEYGSVIFLIKAIKKVLEEDEEYWEEYDLEQIVYVLSDLCSFSGYPYCGLLPEID